MSDNSKTKDKNNWFTKVFKGKEKALSSQNKPDEQLKESSSTVVEDGLDNPKLSPDSRPAATPETAQTVTLENPQSKSVENITDPKQKSVADPEPVKTTASVAEKKPKTLSWFEKLTAGLKKSASALSDGISGIFTKGKLDDDTLEDLEDLLITADLGVAVAAKLTTALAKGRYDKEISVGEIKQILSEEVEAIIAPVAKPLVIKSGQKPHVILMTGVNGAGKTTTIGKLAKQYKDQGKSVMLAAADTFRAAAIDQLKVWGNRCDVPVIAKNQGSDPAAVAYEALDEAINKGMDILIIDTAGRLQNRDELMAELSKIVRVISKRIEGAPHDTLIILDATTGQNALVQVEAFQKAADISGLIMTKLDGSARGGVLVACADKFGLPIHAIGVGEAIDDLQPFEPKDFATSLLGLVDQGVR